MRLNYRHCGMTTECGHRYRPSDKKFQIIGLIENPNTVCKTEMYKVIVSESDVNFLRERCNRRNSTNHSCEKSDCTHTQAQFL